MFPLFRRNLPFLSSSPFPIRLTSSFSQPHCEPKAIIPISVWWDTDYCHVPEGCSIFKIRLYIFNTLRKNGFKGALDVVHCFGDEAMLLKGDRGVLESSSTIKFHHVSGGHASNHFLPNLKYWLNRHPPPYHMFMITGDPEHLYNMRLTNYNVLVAAPKPTEVLCGAATILWEWSSIVNGEYLKRTLCNSPPDAPECSWYGDSGLSFAEKQGGADEDEDGTIE